MGTPIVGQQAIVALKKGTVWGTAVAAGALNGLFINSEGIQPEWEDLPAHPLGLAFENAADRGKQSISGSFPADLDYNNQDVAIALAMGTAGTPATLESGAAYLHTWDLADSIFGLFGTTVFKKKSDLVWEYPSVKYGGFVVKGSMRGVQMIEFSVITDTLNRNGGTGTNNTTTIATVTTRALIRAILDQTGYFRINNQSGIALATGDRLPISDYTLTFQRKLEGVHVADGTSGVSEPLDTDFATITFEVSLPDLTDTVDALMTDWYATPRTPKKGELYLQGPLIAGVTNYSVKILMPHLDIMKIGAPLGGPGRIPSSIMFAVRAADTAPAGMTGVTKPFRWLHTNIVGVNALA